MKHAKIVLAVLTATLSTAAFSATEIDLTAVGATSGKHYTGSFKYNGIVYGPTTAVEGVETIGGAVVTVPSVNKIDIDILPKDTVITSLTKNTAATTDKDIYTATKLYVQDFSHVIANTSRSIDGFYGGDSSFVQEVGGSEYTSIGALATNGTYTYKGVVMTPASNGYFEYNITSVGGALTGNGYVEDNTYTPTKFTLDSASVVETNSVLGVINGPATLVTPNTNNIYPTSGIKYDLTVFGDNGEEVAGRLHGLHNGAINGQANDWGLAGKK